MNFLPGLLASIAPGLISTVVPLVQKGLEHLIGTDKTEVIGNVAKTLYNSVPTELTRGGYIPSGAMNAFNAGREFRLNSELTPFYDLNPANMKPIMSVDRTIKSALIKRDDNNVNALSGNVTNQSQDINGILEPAPRRGIQVNTQNPETHMPKFKLEKRRRRR